MKKIIFTLMIVIFLATPAFCEDMKVVKTKFYFGPDTWLGPAPRAKVTLENLTDTAVKTITCSAVLITPGRTYPWAQGRFTINIRGGVEPKETRTIDVNLGYTGDFSTASIHKGAVLNIYVVSMR